MRTSKLFVAKDLHEQGGARQCRHFADKKGSVFFSILCGRDLWTLGLLYAMLLLGLLYTVNIRQQNSPIISKFSPSLLVTS